MAVLPMKRINIYGLRNQRKAILELLQRKSQVEIIDTDITDDDKSFFAKQDVSTSKNKFESNEKSIAQAVAILDSLAKPENTGSMFSGRDVIDVTEYHKTETDATENIKCANRIIGLSKKISDYKADIVKNKGSIEALEPWLNLDISMRIKETESTIVFLGILPEEYDETKLKTAIAKNDIDTANVYIEILSASVQQTCFFAICHKKVCGEVESALRNIGMSYPVSLSKVPPRERVKILNERIVEAEKKLSEAEKEIISYKNSRKSLLYTADYLSMRTEKYDALAKLLQTTNAFVVEGFITEEDSAKLKGLLEKKFECFVEIEDTRADDNVPIKLKNNGFAAPIEGVVESYSLPNRNEFDPSTITAIFYYFLFGMMLSDLAYGLIMVIGCGVVLAKNKNMETGLKNSVKMFLYCGISTAFWGVMFGSFFGDVIEVVSATFFGTQLSTPALWFKPLTEPMTLLMFSLLLGIIHLFAGLAMKFYILARDKKYYDAVCDVIFWYFLVGGGVIYFMSTEMFLSISGLGFTLPLSVGNVGAVLAIIGAIGIVLTGGRDSKNPAIRLMKGIYGLYGATSYIGDILSYSRLLALGLATGVIASVFNQMGAMAGGGFTGAIVFVLVFLVGHSINIGLNVLGAYVHSNRLEYVEFFGKFYEGGGRKFNPFQSKTKHFKVMEEK